MGKQAEGPTRTVTRCASGRPTLVIVHWNQPDAVAATIASFRRGTVVPRFLVVDNASRSEERERLALLVGEEPDVTILDADRNDGFGAGANAGLRRWLADPLAGEWVLLCPHDVEVDPDTVRRLLDACAAEPMAGLACADVGDGHTPYIDPYFGGMTMPGSPDPGWQDADYPHGTLMVLRRACLEEVGLFDESFFAYCEEADLALRARRCGWTSGLVRGAMVRNVTIGSSVALVDYLQQRNTLRLVRSMSGRYHVFVRICITLGQIVEGLVAPRRRPYVFAPRARLLAIRDHLRGVVGPPPADLR
ncbi:MAG: glycosyltransferase [Microthrixaceae bacterium]